MHSSRASSRNRWSSLGTALEAISRHGGHQDDGRIPIGAAHVDVDESNDALYQAPSLMPGFG
jgi:hypothetical protein